MAEEKTTFDKFSDIFFGTIDRVSEGVSAYYDGAIRVNEAEAALSASKVQKQSAQNLADLQNSASASTWAIPEDGIINATSIQGALILSGVLLVGFAFLRGR